MVEVRLVFSGDADLDLYVTDPNRETVYFGNNPSHSGGKLARDVRCDDPTPRVEVVTFENPLPGRYRVGVEYPQRCRRVREAALFRIEIDAKGSHQDVDGEIKLGHLEAVVVEFDVVESGVDEFDVVD